MKRIISKLNPKNLPMSIQQFLLLFSILLLFIGLETRIFKILENNLYNNENYKKYADEFTALINEDTPDYLKYLNSFSEDESIILKIDDNFNLINHSNLVQISINENTYYLNTTLNIKVNDIVYYNCIDSSIQIIDFNYFENAISGTVESITYPTSINYIFKNDIKVLDLLNSLKTENFSDQLTYKTFTLVKENQKYICFLTKNNFNENILVIYTSIAKTEINSMLFPFQIALYVGIGMMFFLICVLMNYLYVKPIKDMRYVAKNIKDLNFTLYTDEYSNRDYRLLGEEINEVSNSLHDVIDNLNYKNDEITKYITFQEEEYQFKKQLVATISHEIKTPLAVIQATICGVLDGIFEGDEVPIELNNVLVEIDNTNSMLQEIVQLYKLESNKFELDYNEINIHHLILKAINELEKIAEKYEQKIYYENSKDIMVFVDEKQIVRVINNILLNAITYSPPKNDIHIIIKETSKYYAFEFINYGITINDDDLTKIFEPFYRVDRSRKKSEDHGNGLGLYLVKEILQKHHFDFGMENVLNGVKFYFIIQKL